MKNIFLALLLSLLLGACTSDNDAHRALEGAGFTEIETQGYSIWGCSDKETFRTKFKARNPQGTVVTGVVCSDWLKAATIRF